MTASIVIGVLVLAAAFAVWIFVFQDIETPAYRLVLRDGAIEVRDYPAMVVAEIDRPGQRWQAVQQGFRPLARYIFARGRSGDRIAMTAPVMQRPAIAPPDGGGSVGAAAQAWTVRFIMPAEHRMATLPEPGDPAVRLTELAPVRRAAIRFSGVATDERLAERESVLRRWLDGRGIEVAGPAEFAYYNDPMTPGFLRRNEVLLDISDTPARAG